ncbi:MAG TPA: hypothetical protein VLJ21_05070 [Candidatus Binatia bacterium]|nr:hypothetical protein [Candidatus Binatia bacterium]
MDREDVSILITSIRNSLYHKNFLVAMTKLVELKKMLVAWKLEGEIDPLIAELGKLAREKGDTDVLDAKLKELDTKVL